MIDLPLLRGRDRYDRRMEGGTGAASGDALTHTVRLEDPDRAVELVVEALPSPSYAILAARCRVLTGTVDPSVVRGAGALAGVGMVAGFSRQVRAALGPGPGADFVLDAAIEVARLARQVARLPRDRAEAATGNPRACWELDRAGFSDLPDSCFTYSDAGRALFEARAVTVAMHPDLYSPRPGQARAFTRRKVIRLERLADHLRLGHAMHDDVHGFDLTLEIDPRAGTILRAESVISRLPYQGICSEPQGKLQTLVGQTLDATFRRRLGAMVGGPAGCAQLFDLTADLLKFVAV